MEQSRHRRDVQIIGQQRTAERTDAALLRYVLAHTGATRRDAAEYLNLSFPNISRTTGRLQRSGILVTGPPRQTGKRGPQSQTLQLRRNLGCSIGLDVDPTHIRAVVLDFVNNIAASLRYPISGTASAGEITDMAAGLAASLMSSARSQNLPVHAAGISLPGPIIDNDFCWSHAEQQVGIMKLQLLEAVKNICRMPTFAVPADLCFAIGHHRIRYPLDTEPEMAVLNRMELSATVIREGWCSSTGQLGMLPYKNGPTKRYYRDVCTGSALVKLAKSRGVELQYSELIESPGNPVVKEWLACAVPSFAQAIYSGVVMYEPCRVIIDGVFNVMPERVRKHLVDLVTKELTTNGLALPRICLFHGDDLMGARGAAFIARDRVADDVIAQVLQS